MFAPLLNATDKEHVCCVAPIGYVAAPSKGFMSKLFGGGKTEENEPVTAELETLPVSTKQPWAKRFFDGSFDTPLTEAVAGPYASALEAVRIAPSAFNHQPIHIVKVQDTFHFYMAPATKYYTWIDAGIAMSHFSEVLNETNPEMKGEWCVSATTADVKATGQTYVCSWKLL